MLDLDTIGYFLFMEQQERQEQERQQEDQEQEDSEDWAGISPAQFDYY